MSGGRSTSHVRSQFATRDHGSPRWQVLLVHGAGSTGATAHSLLAPLLTPVVGNRATWAGIEDRTGDIDLIAERIRVWLARDFEPDTRRLVCGISLGAHAAVRQCRLAQPTHTATRDAPDHGTANAYVLALPAWIGRPDATAHATAESGRRVRAQGRLRTLAEIEVATASDCQWLVGVLRGDWSAYTDEQLSDALLTASGSRAPDLSDLALVTQPTVVIGATGDPLHPFSVAQSWAEAIEDATLVEIDFPLTPGFATPAAVAAVEALLSRVASESGLPG